MNVTVLTFEGCPNSEPTLRLVRQALRELGVRSAVKRIEVRDRDDAERLRFLGSPTVQINGLDVEASRRADAASFSCRMYRTPAGNRGVPPRDMILDALREALRVQ